MNDEKLKKQIGINIATYRKRSGMTQAGLAEKLNYSDKAVSKWERGESVPDVLILCQLAEVFQITVNELVALFDNGSKNVLLNYYCPNGEPTTNIIIVDEVTDNGGVLPYAPLDGELMCQYVADNATKEELELISARADRLMKKYIQIAE